MRVGYAELLSRNKRQLLGLNAFIERVVPRHAGDENADLSRISFGQDCHFCIPNASDAFGAVENAAGQAVA